MIQLKGAGQLRPQSCGGVRDSMKDERIVVLQTDANEILCRRFFWTVDRCSCFCSCLTDTRTVDGVEGCYAIVFSCSDSFKFNRGKHFLLRI